MLRRVRLSVSAARDLARMREWYSQPGSGPTAKARVRRITATLRSLQRHPLLGHPDRDTPDLRLLVSEGHVIVYRVANDTGATADAGDVEIIRIWGPGQERG